MAKKIKKWSIFTGKWSKSNNVAVWPFFCQKLFFQTWTFPCLFYLFNLKFSEFCYVFIKNWQSYKEKLFFADILKYLQLCLTILHMSWIYLQNMWKLLLLHNCRFADKGKIDHWQSYVKKVWYSQSSMINARKYC